jgi:hypothetical protein
MVLRDTSTTAIDDTARFTKHLLREIVVRLRPAEQGHDM